MSTQITIKLNGRAVTQLVEPRTSLADLVRGPCNLPGTHLGCEHGVCGACTVVVDGAPMRSCILYAVQADGSEVRTIEGFDDDALMEELRDAFTRHHALQCGFCTPGMLVTARDIVLRFDAPDERRIREELGGNLCRCTGYAGIVAAIREVSARGHAGRKAPEPVAVPVPQATRPAAVIDSQPLSEPAAAAKDMVTIHESVPLPHTPERVWAKLADLHQVALCLPGAQLTSIDGDRLEGIFRIKLGPIASAFEVSGTQRREEARRHGQVAGQGRDKLTGSRARGRIDFGVVPGDGDNCRLEVTLAFSLQGVLAQFSRNALVEDLARQLIAQFAANLSAAIEGRAVASGEAAGSLNAGAMLLAGIRRWLSGVFRRR